AKCRSLAIFHPTRQRLVFPPRLSPRYRQSVFGGGIPCTRLEPREVRSASSCQSPPPSRDRSLTVCNSATGPNSHRYKMPGVGPVPPERPVCPSEQRRIPAASTPRHCPDPRIQGRCDSLRLSRSPCQAFWWWIHSPF